MKHLIIKAGVIYITCSSIHKMTCIYIAIDSYCGLLPK